MQGQRLRVLSHDSRTHDNMKNQPTTHQPKYHMKPPKVWNTLSNLGQLAAMTKLKNQLDDVTSPVPMQHSNFNTTM